jgi:phosphate/phosphite/phosphonate ABC transporter binding protein
VLRFALPPSLGHEELAAQTRALRDALTDLLAMHVDVTISQSYEALTRNLLSGAIDAAHAPPFVCAQVEPQGVGIVARVVRHGRATYGSALVKKRGSVVSLKSPRGLRAAWVDPRSVAGYLLPVAHLREQRLIEPDRLFGSQTFYGSYPAALAAVLDGDADLAAIHGLRDRPQAAAEAARVYAGDRAADVEVLEVTAEVPGDGIAVRAGVDAAALRDAFLHMGKEADTRLLLESLFHADGFEPAPPRGYRALYAVAPKDL